jgi:hypothetical protein
VSEGDPLENAPKLLNFSAPPDTSARMAPTKPPAFLRPELHLEWSIITTAHHNLLIVGAPAENATMLQAVERYLQHPIVRCQAQPGVALPEPAAGTLIVSEVTRLDPAQQTQLLEWMNRVRRDVQVVCTSSQPIFRKVLSGAFLSELYYRINALRLDLSDPSE